MNPSELTQIGPYRVRRFIAEGGMAWVFEVVDPRFDVFSLPFHVGDFDEFERMVAGPMGQKIGRAERVFVNRDQEPEYVRVRIGLIGRRSVLIPAQFAEIDDERRILILK